MSSLSDTAVTRAGGHGFRFALYLLVVLVALLIPQRTLFAQEPQGTAALFALSAEDAAGFVALDAQWQAALAQVLVADQAYLGGPALYTLTAFDTDADASGDWALAVVVPSAVVDAGWEGVALDQLVDVLLHRSVDGQIEGRVRTSPAFGELARRVPARLVDYSALFAFGPATQHTAAAYLFPWTRGQTWWLGGGWHTGYGANALDFGPLRAGSEQAAVLASAGGTLRMACQNDGEQRLLWIEHPNGERTGYLHLDRASVAAAVEEKHLVGQHVEQGALLGTVYAGEAKTGGVCPPSFPACSFNTLCGYGSGPHLHFVLPNRDVILDGIAADAIGSGQAGDRFTSSNRLRDTTPDAEPPSVMVTWPLSGSTALAPAQDATFDVDLAVTDPGGSGVADVQVQMAWRDAAGSWSATEWISATASTPGSYRAGFAGCTLAWRVPHNQPLRISVQATDQAGNRAHLVEAGLYRYSFPDLNHDCAVELQDLLVLLSALRSDEKARPEHDVNGDGSVDGRDSQALLDTLYVDGTQQSTGMTQTARAATPPGFGRRLIFSLLAVPSGLGTVRDVALLQTAALAVDWRSASLALVDLSLPAAPTVAGRLSLGDRIYGVTAANGWAFVSDAGDASTGQMQLLDVAQPFSPTRVSTLALSGAVMESAQGEGRLYVAAGHAGVHIVDTASVQTPTLLATLDTPGSAVDVSLSDGVLFVADQETGLLVYRSAPTTDTATLSLAPAPLTPTLPISPVLAASWDTPGVALGVTAAFSTVYVADGLGGVQILDAADPGALRLLATYPTWSAANSVVISGTTLLVAAGWQGVLALDVGDPLHPVLVGSYDTSGYAHDLALGGNLLVVADGPAGMQVLRVDEQPAPSHYLLIPFVANSPP